MKGLPFWLGTGENPLPVTHIYTLTTSQIFPGTGWRPNYVSNLVSPLPPTDLWCQILTVRDALWPQVSQHRGVGGNSWKPFLGRGQGLLILALRVFSIWALWVFTARQLSNLRSVLCTAWYLTVSGLPSTRSQSPPLTVTTKNDYRPVLSVRPENSNESLPGVYSNP